MADNGDDAIHSHLKVQLGTVPQVVALTQGTINYNLKVLFFNNKDFKMVHVDHGDTSMQATMKAGQITIPATDNAGKTVFYHCFFTSGTAKLPSETGGTPVNVDLKDWEFVFAIDVGKIKMENGPKRDKVAKGMNRSGNFDILALFLDFTKNQIASYERPMSKFPGHDLQGAQLQSFLALMQEWAKSVATQAQEAVTFSYVLQTQQPKTVAPDAPMFPPSELLNIQTYPYKTPKTGNTEAGLTKAGNRNMLLFILGSDAIRYPGNSLRWTGNLVMEDIPGTICINRKVIWDAFLLQQKPYFLLNDVNFVMCGFAHIDHFTLSPGSNNYPKVDFGVRFGINDPNRVKDGPTYAWVENTRTETWEWGKSATADTNAEYDKAHGVLSIECRSSSSMAHQPPTNSVKCEGTNEYFFGFRVNDNNMNQPKHLASASIHITMTWTLIFNFLVNDEGDLTVSIDFPKDKYSLVGEVTKQEGMEMTHFKDDMIKQFGDARTVALDRMQKECVPRLKQDIARIHQFTLPGSGTFTYKNPVWTGMGDLMVDVNYVQGT